MYASARSGMLLLLVECGECCADLIEGREGPGALIAGVRAAQCNGLLADEPSQPFERFAGHAEVIPSSATVTAASAARSAFSRRHMRSGARTMSRAMPRANWVRVSPSASVYP